MTVTEQTIPSEHNDEYIAGDTAVFELTVTDGDDNAKDVAGADVSFAVSEYRGQEPLIEKTTANGITIVDGANGRVDIRVNSDDTVGLGDADGQDYYYEIEITDGTGDVATVTTGTWTIHANTASFG